MRLDGDKCCLLDLFSDKHARFSERKQVLRTLVVDVNARDPVDAIGQRQKLYTQRDRPARTH